MSVKNDCMLPSITMDFNTLMESPLQYVQQQQADMAAVARHISRRKALNEGLGLSPTEVGENLLKDYDIPLSGQDVNTWLESQGYQTKQIETVNGKKHNFFFATQEAIDNAWVQLNQATKTQRSLKWHPEIVNVMADYFTQTKE